MGQLTNNGKTIIEEDSDGDSNIRPDSLNGTVIPVGPSGKYADLSSAYADLSPSASNRFVLSLTDNITEATRVQPTSHVDLRGNGYTIVSNEGDQAAVHFRGKRDCTWRDVTIDHQGGAGTFTPLRFTSDDPTNEQTLRFSNIVTVGDTIDNSHGLRVRHSARPKFTDCVFISGTGTGCDAAQIKHGSSPEFSGCDFYARGGNSGVGVRVQDASTATFQGCSAYAQDGNDAYSWVINDNSAPQLQGCYGGGIKYSYFVNIPSGTTNKQINPTDPSKNSMDGPLQDSDFKARLEGITINVYNAVTGATLDIGTSNGGTEIADGWDMSNGGRQNYAFSEVNIAPGDTWYIAPSDTNVEGGLRYTVRKTGFQAHGLTLLTRGRATITGGTFIGGKDASGGLIDTTTRRYEINGSTFVNHDSGRAALDSPNTGSENVSNFVATNTNSSGSDTNNIS